MNLGATADVGVAGHLHLYAVPCWISETRTLPEALPVTWERLRKAFAELIESGPTGWQSRLAEEASSRK